MVENATFFVLLCFIVEMRIFTFGSDRTLSIPLPHGASTAPMIEHNRNESHREKKKKIFLDLPFFSVSSSNFTKKICGNSVIALCISNGANAADDDDDDVIVGAAASTHQTLLLIDGFLLLLLFISTKMSSDTLCCYVLRSLCYRFSNKTFFLLLFTFTSRSLTISKENSKCQVAQISRKSHTAHNSPNNNEPLIHTSLLCLIISS